ncbi:RAxF-45 family protein [Jeotgalibacillus sp. R-1-5s-1]|nr:RAxF-45 family protein [Jeotgalibacillus sp. R-1-5s-1]
MNKSAGLACEKQVSFLYFTHAQIHDFANNGTRLPFFSKIRIKSS